VSFFHKHLLPMTKKLLENGVLALAVSITLLVSAVLWLVGVPICLLWTILTRNKTSKPTVV
jgi:hypothetical protein